MYLQKETEEKARQPETKLGVIAQTRHTTRLRNAKRARTKHPKPTHGARDKPRQGEPKAGRDRASRSGQRHASRRIYAPDRHRDALPRQRATLRSRSAPETGMLIYVLRDFLESKMQKGRQDRSPVIHVKAGTMQTGPMSKSDV
jgi:hypothetical protein